MKNYDIKQMAEYYFNSKLTNREIAKIFNISPCTVTYQLKRNGYTLIDKVQYGNNRKHSIDLNFFKTINSSNKAYILGLILSDGYVDDYTKLTFTSKDIELVKIFKKELKSEHKLATYDVFDKRTNKTYTRHSIKIASKEIVSDLNKLGVFSKKSFTCTMPEIPEAYFWHFIRGLFDGDGSISKGSMRKEGALQFSIIGSENMLRVIKNKFKLYGLSNTKFEITKYHSEDDHIAKLHYYSYNDLFFLNEKIYENSEGLRLTRKYDVFQTLKEYRLGTYDRTPSLRQISMYDLENNLLKMYKNIHEACDENNLSYKTIHRVAMGERNHTHYLVFRYV